MGAPAPRLVSLCIFQQEKLAKECGNAALTEWPVGSISQSKKVVRCLHRDRLSEMPAFEPDHRNQTRQWHGANTIRTDKPVRAPIARLRLKAAGA